MVEVDISTRRGIRLSDARRPRAAGLVCSGDVGETADVGRVYFPMLGLFMDLSGHLQNSGMKRFS